MPFNYYVVQVILEAKSLLPEDAVMNTLAFRTPGADAPLERGTIDLRIVAAYNQNNGNWGKDLSGKTTRKLYQADDLGELGSPVDEQSSTHLIVGTAEPMPAEVALCLSFHGNLTDVPEEGAGATRPAARHRGRIYVGTFDRTCNEAATTTNRSRPTTAVRTNLLAMANSLKAITNGVEWCVHSHKNNAWYPVTGGWVDDAWDTQRRRGPAATARTAFTVP